MPRYAVLPFTMRKSRDVYTSREITTTTETVHGLLRLEGEELTVQWRLARKIETVGSEIRSDEELEAVREVSLPLASIGGAVVRRTWWNPISGLHLVLTAADLRAFEAITGEDGLRAAHPANVRVRIARRDRLAAEEFSAELALALAERALADPGAGALPAAPRPAPRGPAGLSPADEEPRADPR